MTDLETEASLMKAFESQLSDIAWKQGISVDKIVSLIRENEEILTKQKVWFMYIMFVITSWQYTNNRWLYYLYFIIDVQSNLKVIDLVQSWIRLNYTIE